MMADHSEIPDLPDCCRIVGAVGNGQMIDELNIPIMVWW
jgi:hypothetical protein